MMADAAAEPPAETEAAPDATAPVRGPAPPPSLRLLLDLDPAEAAVLARNDLILAHAPKRPVVRRLRQVFWDTPGDLVPVSALDLPGTVWQLQWGETQLSLTLERAAIEAGAGKLEPCQIELALQAGPAEGLYEFAAKLHRSLAFRLATRDAVQQA